MNPPATPQPEEENHQPEEAAEAQREQYWFDRMLHTPLVIPTAAEREELDQLTLSTSIAETLHWSNESLMNPETVWLDMMKYHDQRIKLRLEQAQRTSTASQQQVHEQPEPEPLRITPDPHEVQEIEGAIPDEWKQAPTPEPDRDQVIEHLSQMSDSELARQLDVPEGDIDQNARQAVQEMQLDVQAILQEQEPTPPAPPTQAEQTPTHDDDFGR
jgi:hypothetical protein